jgi:hypothetical protein
MQPNDPIVRIEAKIAELRALRARTTCPETIFDLDVRIKVMIGALERAKADAIAASPVRYLRDMHADLFPDLAS